jgi:prolyl oligopeptidase
MRDHASSAAMACLVGCLFGCPGPASSPAPAVPGATGAAGAPAVEAAAPLAPAEASIYPPTPRGDVVDTLHGIEVADPYRGLEAMDAPATREWVAAQNAFADKQLGSLALRPVLSARIAELMAYAKTGIPQLRGNRYFWYFHDGKSAQPVVLSAASLDGATTTVVDANALSKDGSLAFAGFVAAEKTYAAYGVAPGSGDWQTWRIRELATGRDLPEELPHIKYYNPVFTRDGTGIYYSRFPAPKPGTELVATDRDCKVYFHKIGTPVDRDVVVYERVGQPTEQFELAGTRDGRYLVISIGDGQVGDRGQEQIAYLDMTKRGATVKPLVDKYDAEYVFVGSDGPLLLFQTSLDAPKKRIIAIDVRAPDRSRWKTIVPENDLVIEGAATVGKQLLVSRLRDAHTAITAYDLRGRKLRDVALPDIGTAYVASGKPGAKHAFYYFASPTTPGSIYRLDLATGKSTPWRRPKVAFDPSQFETQQFFYPSKDGTKIPMFVTAKKGLPKDGKRPTVITGYGWGGISLQPYFDGPGVAWLERGGVAVIANIRGGGEYGEAWHFAARRTKRQVQIDDFIAAGEYLIKEGYTSPAHLGIMGGSGGGTLVAITANQRPDLYGAVVPASGVHDLLRFQLFGQGAGWQGDMGSPDDPTEFAVLHKLSPLHNVHPGTRYPATLVVTADTDARVAPLHSYKYAAALQHAQAGPAPIILRVETKSGHSGGGTLAQKIGQRAETMAFLAHHLGME